LLDDDAPFPLGGGAHHGGDESAARHGGVHLAVEAGLMAKRKLSTNVDALWLCWYHWTIGFRCGFSVLNEILATIRRALL
jgi:hypothetical protein